MVCKACQDVLLRRADLCWGFNPRKDDADFIHHRTFESLRKAAEDQKCFFCYDLWTQLGPEAGRLAIGYESTPEHRKTNRRQYISHGSIEKKIKHTESPQKTKSLGIFSSFRGSDKGNTKESGPWRLHLAFSHEILRKFTERNVYAFYELCDSRGE